MKSKKFLEFLLTLNINYINHWSSNKINDLKTYKSYNFIHCIKIEILFIVLWLSFKNFYSSPVNSIFVIL